MGRGRTLTEQDDYFIMINWEDMTNVEMAKKLGVHKETIARRGEKLGLINKKSVASGNYKRSGISEQIEKYIDSAETVQESEGRKKTLELLQLKEMLNINNNLKLKVKGDTEKIATRVIDGTVVQKNDSFIAVKLENYTECFKYTDFYTGKAVII